MKRGIKFGLAAVLAAAPMAIYAGGAWDATDAFAGLEECRTVDAAFRRQPTSEEASLFLQPCLDAVAARNGNVVDIRASAIGLPAPGDQGVVLERGIVIYVSGGIPVGNTILLDLQSALDIRGGSLFGYPAAVVDLGEVKAQTQTETFKLYSERHHVPNPACDRGTQLVIDDNETNATLTNFVDGVCEIMVDPNPRVYKLKPGIGNAAGTRTYGERATSRGVNKIEIIDSRSSVLSMVSEALIIVVERLSDGRTATFFSLK